MKFLYLSNTNQILKYPVTLDDIRAELPYISFNNTNDADGVLNVCLVHIKDKRVVKLTPVDPPVRKHFQTVTEGTPEFRANTWRQTWVVTDLPVAIAKIDARNMIENKADEVRRALVENDSMHLEYDLVASEAKAYRANGGPVPESVQTWMDIKNISAAEATDEILKNHAEYVEVLQLVRKNRLLGKEGLKTCPDTESVRNLLKMVLENLSVLEDRANKNGGF